MTPLDPSDDQPSPWNLGPVPPTIVPSLESLQNKVTARRHRRRRLVASSGLLLAVTCGSLMLLNRGDQESILPEPLESAARTDMIARNGGEVSVEFPTGALSSSTTAGSTNPGNMEIAENEPRIIDIGPATQLPNFPVSLFADVRTQDPVFQFDPERQAMVPVGWLRSNNRVPVQLDAFTDEQIQTLQTVLHGDSSPTSL